MLKITKYEYVQHGTKYYKIEKKIAILTKILEKQTL